MSLRIAQGFQLLSTSAIGPFAWRWPAGIETYERGWMATARADGQEWHIRHGIGRRVAFGRSRVHSVTWVEGEVAVEGVEADDFGQSQALLSLIKTTKKHLRPGSEIPPEYRAFQVVSMADEVSGPHSFIGLAVKLRLDDVDGWTRHALLRAAAWGRLSARHLDPPSLPATTAGRPAPLGTSDATWVERRQAIVAALLEYGSHHESSERGGAPDFTTSPEANALLRSDPFAFLCAVIFDQGVTAERAWLAPYLLKARLGHLDPPTIARAGDAVSRAIQEAPKLHRYVSKMPTWIVRAAQMVVDRYHGDASAIWSDNPAADELQRRLDGFAGIGQKKAAMAVEILARDLDIPVRHMDRGDIAYDVHLRRVFLRTRLADRDDRDHMIDVARELHPTRPGALDLPTWLIGRGWCHPGVPDCFACPLTAVCPKEAERAAHVTSG